MLFYPHKINCEMCVYLFPGKVCVRLMLHLTFGINHWESHFSQKFSWWEVLKMNLISNRYKKSHIFYLILVLIDCTFKESVILLEFQMN